MKPKLNLLISLSIVISFMGSCKKEQGSGSLIPPPGGGGGNTPGVATALKAATDVMMGVAVPYNKMMTDVDYPQIVKRDFDAITFENEMKHFALVQSDGSINFTKSDALVNAATAAGLKIFGHTLGWHSGQNASYLKNFAGIHFSLSDEIITNSGFENGLTDWSVFNTGNPAGTATITANNVNGEVYAGNGAMKVVSTVAYPGDQWRVQVASPLFNTVIGKQYTISYWVKATNSGGSIRLSTNTVGGGSAQYQSDQSIGTSWQQVKWTITANSPQTRFLFDMGQVVNTYFIDNASVKEVSEGAAVPQAAAKLDEALQTFISALVGRYKGKVYAWDVINELFTWNGTIRNNSNTETDPADVLVWSHYLGRDFAYKAFKYAEAADPAADLFINDYSLEASNAKLDSLIAFVAELKSRGAKVNGIGSQMHVSINTSNAGIDNMMKKLAATGLKVRISELDVRANPDNLSMFSLTPTLAASQASKYKYIIQSYLTHVPKAQQAGITFWGLTDNTSWLYKNGTDYPLLYNSDYTKKAAYTAVLEALQGK